MNIYLSPHHDDICFSLAATVQRRRGGQLVNLFTRAEHVLARTRLPRNREARVREVTRLRTTEDQEFAAESSLTRHDLMLDEPALLGIHAFDTTNLDPEIKLLQGPLMELLQGFFLRQGPAGSALFCPMGIGGHRNHLSTLIAVAENLPRLKRSCRIFLYEDLPYASNPVARARGVARALKIMRGEPLARLILPLSSEAFTEKLRSVGLYASQHPGPPPASSFIPAAPDVTGPHEALWRVGRPSTSPSQPSQSGQDVVR